MSKREEKTIAIVINTTWNIYNFRLGLLKALQREGYRVIAIAPSDVYVQRLEEEGIACFDIQMNNKGTNPIEDIRLIFDFYRLYRKLSPDVILHYTIKPNIYGSLAAGFLAIPVISNISGLGTVFLNDAFSSKVARLLYRVALKVPKKVFFQNSHDKALFVSLSLVKKQRTDVLAGSGVDVQKFAPRIRERRSEKRSFLFIGRLITDKGVLEYAEAARELSKEYTAVFYVLGGYYANNPSAIDPKQMQAWEREGVVTYLGETDEVAEVIASVDCVVLPSYREGLSRVLLEAASMAKPLVTTRVPGCQEVVEDGITGYLCQVRSSDALAAAMKNIIALSSSECIAMGQRGREKMKQEFDEKKVILKYKEALSEIFQHQS